MRKTYSNSSRSTAAVEDADYDELPADERPRARRQKSGASQRSRFDDYESESLNFDAADDDSAYGPHPAPRSRAVQQRSARGRRSGPGSEEQTLGQWLLRSTAGRWVLGGSLLLLLAVVGAGTWLVREFLRTDPRFRVASSDQIQLDGNKQVTSDQVRSIFGEDIGRNLFFIPIRERQQQMEALPWVERASVERLLPNHIRVHVTERVPVAFAQDGDRIELVDSYGALLDTPSGVGVPQYSFPVLDGMGSDIPLSVRAARMNAYLAFLKELDGHGEKVSARLSEVDLSEPEDMQVVIPEGNSAITLHLGESHWFERYRLYQAHIGEWQQQYPRLAKVDLRNAPQVILGMAAPSTPLPVPASPSTAAAGSAIAAGSVLSTKPEAASPAAVAPAPSATATAAPASAVIPGSGHVVHKPVAAPAHPPAHAAAASVARTHKGVAPAKVSAHKPSQPSQSSKPVVSRAAVPARPALHMPSATKTASSSKSSSSTAKSTSSTTKSTPALKKPATQGGQG